MLAIILGSETAARILIHLYHYGESYPSAVAHDFSISLGQVQRQFDRLERAQIIISKLRGRTRGYQFNYKSPLTRPFVEMVKRVYESMDLDEKARLFTVRRRERRAGKPIKILSPSDCVKDRLASYIYFKDQEGLDQALLVARRQPINLKEIKKWCDGEHRGDVYKFFLSGLKRLKKQN